MIYYKLTQSNVPLKFNSSNQYYSDKNGTRISTKSADVYTKVSEYDENQKDNYYTYDSVIGKYLYCGSNLTRFYGSTTYYIKSSSILLQYNQTSIYEYKDYQAATTIKPNQTYYTRKSLLRSDGTEYKEYSISFSLNDLIYYETIDGTECIVTSMIKSHTYYNKDEDGNKINIITIPTSDLFIYEGYIKIDFDMPIGYNDYCYYFDDNNKKNYLPQGYIIMGKVNYIYKDSSDELKKDDFTDGYYYLRTSKNNFEKVRVIKQYDRNKEYYTMDDLYQKAQEFVNGTTYYISLVNNDSPKKKYYPWEDIFNFNLETVPLYIINDDGEYTVHIGAGNGNQRKVSRVNKQMATYNSSITYYAQSSIDRHFYEVPKEITEDNFSIQVWGLYEKARDVDIVKKKHMSYSSSIVKLYGTNEFDPETYWNKDVNNPEDLIFWFDFLDTEGDISRYNNGNIGNRPKAKNDSNVKAIYYRETPNVIFVDSDIDDDDFQNQKDEKPGYTFIKLTQPMENLFSISSQGKSCQDELNDLLYSNTYCAESITITCLPVYHLQPNTRIFVRDDNSGINGEYIITKITMPLTYNGMMTISATKAVSRIY